MASSSRSAAATYQVFLSFRGPDTRQGFTDVLYHALEDAGVRVFRDDEELHEGEEIGGEILRAIKESGIFVPIFSRGYAASKWCLIELAKMVELIKDGSSGKKILPIFYDVGADDVKLETKLYRKALRKLSKKYDADTLQQWKEALQKAGKFKGREVKKTGHGEFIKSFARLVSMKLKVNQKYVTEYLVPRDDQDKALTKLLDCDSYGVRFVGISGMGGIGKTTLAKLVFNKLCHRFDGCSFLADVRESSRQHKGIESLQKQLLKNLTTRSGDITDGGDVITQLRTTLRSKKVLIVLDDVDSKDQIHNLAGDASWFGLGTRIIITTRDQSVLKIRRLGIQKLEVEELKPEEASRLFCMHAFGKDTPPDDYLSLLKNAVQSTGGLPLALEVIGSYLGAKPREEWRDAIKWLEKAPLKDIREKLMISYESLSPRTKEMFLDISCFFVHEEKTYPIYMWQGCKFDREMGLEELVYKSLVKLIEKEDEWGVKWKTLWMHDQLRDLGREIVNSKSIADKVKPSRLWLRGDASKMLHLKEGKEQIEMLRFECGDYTFTHKDISSLRDLRYLECSKANFPWELTDMLPELIWLSWHECLKEFVGTGIFFSNLVILDLSNSHIDENWGGWTQIGVGSKLKVLDLSYCAQLRRTPDLSGYSSLERLILAHCTNLVEIDPSIGKLKCLNYLEISYCGFLKGLPYDICFLYDTEVLLEKLSIPREDLRFRRPIGDLTFLSMFHRERVELPQSIDKLTRLRHLSFHGSIGLEVLPDALSHMKSLVQLDLSCTLVAELPDTIGQLVNLEVLSLSGCCNVKKLPVSIGNMRSLVKLDLSGTGITELPDSIGKLENLRVMDMRSTEIKELPYSFGMLKRLEELDASSTPLEEIPSTTILGLICLKVLKLKKTHLCLLSPKLPTELTWVQISSFSVLETLPEFSNLQNLVRLVLEDCYDDQSESSEGCYDDQSESSEDCCDDQSESSEGCYDDQSESSEDCCDDQSESSEDCYDDQSESSEVQSIELEGIGKLHSLVELDLSLWNVTRIPEEFSSLPQLQRLTLGCPNLRCCPPLPSTLLHLSLRGHGEKTELPQLTNLKNLLTLEFQECCIRGDTVGNLGVGELESLTSLSLIDCKFGNLDMLRMPWNLCELYIRRCVSLEALPALSHLKNLKKLNIEGAGKLVEIIELGELDSLQVLSIERCDSIATLSDMSKLKMLRSINIEGCQKFRGIDGINELKSLEHLWIQSCDCEDIKLDQEACL